MDDPRTLSGSADVQLPQLLGGRLRVLDGPNRGADIALSRSPSSLGSAPTCTLTLKDPKVSRLHCEVSVGARGFLVRDCGSRNGTYFEGSRIQELAVPPGTILRVGSTHVVLTAVTGLPLPAQSERAAFGKLVGKSVEMRRVFAELERAAKSDASVLLAGETGTGKELAARALHEAGPRAKKPFVVFDCASVAPELLQSALFGYEAGAFTGARDGHAGIFERADGGTVFLDEVDELSLELQPSLLRVVERGELTRLGGTRPFRVSTRLIASTRSDLPERVAAGKFREDLYYRLAVVTVTLPALRARRDDVPLLCAQLLRELGCADPGPIDGPNLALLLQQTWPGNIRELRNALESALVMAGPDTPFERLPFKPNEGIPRRDAPAALAGGYHAQKKRALEQFERDYLERLLRDHQGNIKQSARAAGVEKTQFKRLLKRHGLR